MGAVLGGVGAEAGGGRGAGGVGVGGIGFLREAAHTASFN